MKTRDVLCYFWTESEEDITSNSFASCVFDYISEIDETVKTLIIYSEGCTYQNRNITLSNTLIVFQLALNNTEHYLPPFACGPFQGISETIVMFLSWAAFNNVFDNVIARQVNQVYTCNGKRFSGPT
jgi:hypothetical protein